MSTRRRVEVRGRLGTDPPAVSAEAAEGAAAAASPSGSKESPSTGEGEGPRGERWRQGSAEGEAQTANHRRRQQSLVGGGGRKGRSYDRVERRTFERDGSRSYSGGAAAILSTWPSSGGCGDSGGSYAHSEGHSRERRQWRSALPSSAALIRRGWVSRRSTSTSAWWMDRRKVEGQVDRGDGDERGDGERRCDSAGSHDTHLHPLAPSPPPLSHTLVTATATVTVSDLCGSAVTASASITVGHDVHNGRGPDLAQLPLTSVESSALTSTSTASLDATTAAPLSTASIPTPGAIKRGGDDGWMAIQHWGQRLR